MAILMKRRPHTGVMAPCKVVSSILLPADEQLRVEELAVRACANLIHHCWLQVQKHCPGDILAG